MGTLGKGNDGQITSGGTITAPTGTPPPGALTGANQGPWAGSTGTGSSFPALTPAAIAAGDGLAPLTGWAGEQNLTPAMLNENIYDSPFWLLNNVFPNLKDNMPGYQSLRDFGADPLAIYNMTEGANGMLMGGAGQYANFLANLYQNLGTAGGQNFSMPEMLANIFGQEVTGLDAKNSLGEILGTGNASQQIRTMFNLLRDASNVGMNPLAARAYQASVAAAGDRYGSQALNQDLDQTKGFNEYLKNNFPQLAGR